MLFLKVRSGQSPTFEGGRVASQSKICLVARTPTAPAETTYVEGYSDKENFADDEIPMDRYVWVALIQGCIRIEAEMWREVLDETL